MPDVREKYRALKSDYRRAIEVIESLKSQLAAKTMPTPTTKKAVAPQKKTVAKKKAAPKKKVAARKTV